MNHQYSHLAKIYSHLMKLINYKDWAKYISMLYELLEMEDDRILELAGGQCSISKYLYKQFPNIISSDLSFGMLKECSKPELTKVCCDMLSLPFKDKFAYIFSTFDSVNYLLTEDKLKRLFEGVSDIMVSGGAFTFDVGLERNSVKYQKLLNRSGIYKGIKYTQSSKYDKVDRIHYNSFRFEYENGEIYEETHRQKIYEFEDYFRIIEDTDFYVQACYNSFTFDDANRKNGRVQFVLKKREY